MPSLNIRSLPFVVFMGGFPSRLQNLSSGAIRPGGLLLLFSMIFVNLWYTYYYVGFKYAVHAWHVSTFEHFTPAHYVEICERKLHTTCYMWAWIVCLMKTLFLSINIRFFLGFCMGPTCYSVNVIMVYVHAVLFIMFMYSANHSYLHMPTHLVFGKCNAFGFWQMRLHLALGNTRTRLELLWIGLRIWNALCMNRKIHVLHLPLFGNFDLWSVSVWRV